MGIGFWALAVTIGLLFGATDVFDPQILYEIRLPRVILATAVGMGLAISGLILQALFANPICEPYTLGISSGSALGAVIGLSLDSAFSISGIAGTAFIGALFFGGILYWLSYRLASGTTLLLSGVMLGFLGSSLVALWMAVADPNGIQAAIFWLLGDLSRAQMMGSVVSLCVVLVFTVIVWMKSRDLDSLLLGEELALSLGISVQTLRRGLLFIASMIVGVCVSSAGMIGFIGLMVPHFCRLLGGSLHRRLIPMCAVWGAASLTLADCLARVIAAPIELPVGVVTALVGAPLFFLALFRRSITLSGNRL